MAKIISIVELLERPDGRRAAGSAQSGNISELPRKRGIGRLCAKAFACMVLGSVILLLLFLTGVRMLHHLSLQAMAVKWATPADITSLFGPRAH